MPNLTLVRHGQSVWNLENLFTGWTDVDLSEQGAEEAREAGRLMKKAGLKFDAAFCSVLKRAVRTLHLLEEASGIFWPPEYKSWRLNERHYGALQGLNKAETAQKYGEGQVKIWRRSYDVPPPPLEPDDERSARFERQYAELDESALPLGESLKDTIARTLPYWQDAVAPWLLRGRDVVIVAHGNSLRGLVKHLMDISDTDIVNLEIPTGKPQVFELDEDLCPIRNYYL